MEADVLWKSDLSGGASKRNQALVPVSGKESLR